ncbi:MAG: hypothetical protein ACLU9S_13600 [Oscillospiraceae bacterium]
MRKPAIFVVFLVVVLAVAAGVLWPGQALALREQQLYGQVAPKPVSADSFDSGRNHLGPAAFYSWERRWILPTMDFSVGAQLYDDEYALRRRFVRELREFSEYFPPAVVLNDWMETTAMATEDFHRHAGFLPLCRRSQYR